MLLAAEDDIEPVGEAGSAKEAVFQARSLEPDVILMDVVMPDGSGIDVVPHAAVRIAHENAALVGPVEDQLDPGAAGARLALGRGERRFVGDLEHRVMQAGLEAIAGGEQCEVPGALGGRAAQQHAVFRFFDLLEPSHIDEELAHPYEVLRHEYGARHALRVEHCTADHPDLRVALENTIDDITACDGARALHTECIANFGAAEIRLLEDWF